MSSETANQLRWLGQPGHYEVYYATFSHPQTQTGFWIRYTLESPLPGHGESYAQLWFATFNPHDDKQTFAFNKKFPIESLTSSASPFEVRIGDSVLRNDGMKGALEGAGHTVSWDLTWSPSATVHRQMPSAIYNAKFPDTLYVNPNLNVATHGVVTVDGKRFECNGAPLGQSHLWGRKHAYAWAWAHCNAFEGDRGAAFEALTARIRKGAVVLPQLTMFSLYLDGDEPNLIEFREPWQLPFSRSSYGTGSYHLRGANATHEVDVDFTCRPVDMILTEYVDPDGEAAFCHNTECASAKIVIRKRSPFVGRWREHRTLVSNHMAHYEWGARAGDPLVKKRHVTV